ncbi:MAG: hypothetical protein ACOZAR_02770 [Patescibacteria group bacterium]
MNDVKKFFARAVDGFVDLQRKVGIGLGISSNNRNRVGRAREYQTIFNVGLVLANVAKIKNNKLELTKKKMQDFLLREGSGDWSYNYWVKNSRAEKEIHLPDDLDDTFVVLAALQENNYKFDPKDYAKITNLLVACEDQEGGPYRTWLVGETKDKRWLEVDVAVNGNVGYFLFLNGIELPNLSDYFDSLVLRGKLQSKYYPTVLPVIYFWSRFYRGKNRQILVDILLKKYLVVRGKKNCLDVSLVVLALINFGYQGPIVNEGIEYLLSEYEKDGWGWQAFCLDPMIGREKYYHGSEVLTHSFCLLALNEYMGLSEKKDKNNSGKKIKARPVEYDKVFAMAKKRLRDLNVDLRESGECYLEKFRQKDEDGEIVLLPYVLAKNSVTKMGQKEIDNLCLASLYGWMAYTIYDDFLDDEGEKKYLPVANLWFRELIKIYQNLNIEGLNQWFEKIMDEMEGANVWEVKNCRFDPNSEFDLKKIPRYGQMEMLAGKSLGHALAGVAVLGMTGRGKNLVEDYLTLFRSYLIARQLHDDAHDWEDDLQRGQINAVGAMVLRDYQKINQEKMIELKKKREKLQLIFWNKTIKMVSRLIFREVGLAKKMIKKMQRDLDLSFLEKKLNNLKGGARRAVEESREVREYIDEVEKK